MNAIVPLALLILSGGIFFGYIDGTYADIKDIQSKASSYDEALTNAQKGVAKFDDLQNKYNHISPSEVEQIKRFLPDNIDNIRLIIDINNIAVQHGMSIKGIKIDASKTSGSTAKDSGAVPAQPFGGTPVKENGIGVVGMSFSVTGTYGNFLAFLKDMEKSLRLVDITHITVSAPEAGKVISDYGVSVKTYWLK